MPRLSTRSYLDTRSGNPMNKDLDRAAVGIVAVVVGTKLFTDAGKRLGWSHIAIAVSLYGAGRVASWW